MRERAALLLRASTSDLYPQPSTEGCDRKRRAFVDGVEHGIGEERDRIQRVPDQLLVLRLERQRVEHAVKVSRVDEIEPRVQQELAECFSGKARCPDQTFDRGSVRGVGLELEEADDRDRVVVPHPPE
jgi:hypothetical protein